LAFEATEGGAGVLGRLTSDPNAIANIARTALELMHYRSLDAAITSADPAALIEDENANCVRGCYRCLLSYYNQPDHEQIDRTNDEVKLILLRLARSTVAISTSAKKGIHQNEWHAAFTRWHLPAPDEEPLTVNGVVLPIAWRSRLAAASVGVVDAEIQAAAKALGYTIAILPKTPGEHPPAELVKLLGVDA
jgi:hypothetical protein